MAFSDYSKTPEQLNFKDNIYKEYNPRLVIKSFDKNNRIDFTDCLYFGNENYEPNDYTKTQSNISKSNSTSQVIDDIGGTILKVSVLVLRSGKQIGSIDVYQMKEYLNNLSKMYNNKFVAKYVNGDVIVYKEELSEILLMVSKFGNREVIT